MLISTVRDLLKDGYSGAHDGKPVSAPSTTTGSSIVGLETFSRKLVFMLPQLICAAIEHGTNGNDQVGGSIFLQYD